jgi:HPt (histidine-containing phosphotransfer) domain-containing protein/CheY-like chemotaxis protein
MEQAAFPADMAHRRVLVIDRNVTVALMVCSLLRRWGFEAERDRGEGEVYPEPDWDLVLADPASNPERLGGLRRRGVAWVALISAGDSRETADAAAWIYKPIEAGELQEAIRRALTAETTGTSVGVDTSAIVELWGSLDHPGFRQVANAFLGEIETRVQSIVESLANDNRKQLHLEAHSVGSAAANVGGMAISRAARALEAVALEGDTTVLRGLVEAVENACRRDLPAIRGLAVAPTT